MLIVRNLEYGNRSSTITYFQSPSMNIRMAYNPVWGKVNLGISHENDRRLWRKPPNRIWRLLAGKSTGETVGIELRYYWAHTWASNLRVFLDECQLQKRFLWIPRVTKILRLVFSRPNRFLFVFLLTQKNESGTWLAVAMFHLFCFEKKKPGRPTKCRVNRKQWIFEQSVTNRLNSGFDSGTCI